MRLSYSSASALTRCGEQWRLERRFKIKGRPSWAQVGGTALHAITEAIDLNAVGSPVPIPTAEEALDKAIADQLDNTEFTENDLKPGGRATKQWPDRENRAWWLYNLPVMVQSWRNWSRNVNWGLWITPDGEPGIELEVDFFTSEDGGPQIKGYIDRVYEDPITGTLIVVDLKSGREPKSTAQLGVYRNGLLARYGVYADAGTYWLGRTGASTPLADLSAYTPERLDWEYRAHEQTIQSNLLVPSVGDACSWCSVKDWCYAVGGARANEIPRPWEDGAVSVAGVRLGARDTQDGGDRVPR